ncbi:MAG: NADH-quinone oxidoreductase subunit M, partial [Thermoplasmataceae archaeon]
ISVYSAKNQKYGELFFGLILLSEVGLFGLLISRNFVFFYIFWEVVIVPVFLLIAIYGGEKKEAASLKFFIYTQLGSVFLLLSILTLFAYHYYYSPTHSFSLSMTTLLANSFITGPVIPLFWKYFLLFGFLIAFLVKMPSFPLHSWLPDAYNSAPYPVTIILAGGLSLMGGYGFFAILLPLSPLIGNNVAWIIIILGIISLIYFALVAMMQSNLKKMLAFASAASMGFVNIAFGIGIMETGSLRVLELTGGIFQILAHGLIISLLFATLFMIKQKTGKENIHSMGGIHRDVPFLSSIFLGGLLASLGLPGLAGFISEFSIVAASYSVLGPLIFLVIFGMIITASYHIWAAQRTLYGPYNETLGQLKDIGREDIFALGIILILILLLGIYPNLIFSIVAKYVVGVL